MHPSHYYTGLGWSLCAIPPGSKRPLGNGWQASPLSPAHWQRHPEHGMGVIHGRSGTCTLDVDDVEATRADFARRGLNLDDILAAAVRIAGHPDRAKAIYRLPEGFDPRRVSFRGAYELRGGMTQDVLPPSIHPGTGRPYEWLGDPEDITVLPDALRAVWEDLMRPSRATAQTRAATPRTWQAAGSGGSVISAWSAQVHPGDVLERHGYIPCGSRWVAPQSTSGDPGVVLLPDASPPRVYSHHGSDPLADGHSHDSFSLFCSLEHRGDVTAAVRDAARVLGMDRPPDDPIDPETVAIADMLLRDAEQPEDEGETALSGSQRPAPPHPGPIPGVALRGVYDWIASQLHAPKSGVVTQATLTFAGLVMARRYETWQGKSVAAYLGVTDTSMASHRPVRGAIYRLLDALGERGTIRGTGFTSGAMVARAIHRSPRMCWVTDELGYMCSMARRQQSGAIESALSQISEVYDCPTLYLDPEVLARGQRMPTAQECDVIRPTLAMLCLVPHDQIRYLAQRGEYGRGTLQQIVMAGGGDAVDRPATGDLLPGVAEHITRRLRARWMGDLGHDESPSNPLDPVRVGMTTAAWGACLEGMAALRAIVSAPDVQPWRGMAHGYAQSAYRIMATLAAWDDQDAPCTTETHARWAFGWAGVCLHQTIEELRVQVAEERDADVEQKVLEYIHRYQHTSGGAVTARELTQGVRAYRALAPDRRAALLAALEAAGAVVKTKRKGVAGRGADGYATSERRAS